MPVRPRRRREHRLELTRARLLALEIGPEQRDLDVDLLERLHAVWVEHRSQLGPRSWATQYGHDIRLDDVPELDGSGCPGLPG